MVDAASNKAYTEDENGIRVAKAEAEDKDVSNALKKKNLSTFKLHELRGKRLLTGMTLGIYLTRIISFA